MSIVVEFVCNVPGPIEEVVDFLKETGGVTSAVKPRLFSSVESHGWIQVGKNYVGPAFGDHIEGDAGIYMVC